MSPWPGAPSSDKSPPINPPSQRFPFTLNEHSSMGDVADAMRTVFNGLTNHEQAFANLPGQIASQATAAATTVVNNIASEQVSPSVKAFNSLSGLVFYYPSLGQVHSEVGQTSYTTQQADAGAVVVLGDSSPVALSLNANVLAPWFCLVSNMDSSAVTITPTSGLVNGDSSLTLPGYSWGIVFFNSQDFIILGVAA